MKGKRFSLEQRELTMPVLPLDEKYNPLSNRDAES